MNLLWGGDSWTDSSCCNVGSVIFTIFIPRVYYPRASHGQWLNTAGIPVLGHPCTTHSFLAWGTLPGNLLLQCSPFPCLLQSTPTQSCSHPSRISQMPALHHICGSTQFCFISPLCCTVIGKANLPWSSGGDRVAFIQWRQEEMHMYLTKATLTPLGTHLLKSNSEWTHVTVQIWERYQYQGLNSSQMRV